MPLKSPCDRKHDRGSCSFLPPVVLDSRPQTMFERYRGEIGSPFLGVVFRDQVKNEGELPFRSRSRCTCPRSGSESSWGDFRGTVLPLRSSHDWKYNKDPALFFLLWFPILVLGRGSGCTGGGSEIPGYASASVSSSRCSLPREQCVDESEVLARIIGYLVSNYPIQEDLGTVLASRTRAISFCLSSRTLSVGPVSYTHLTLPTKA